MPYGKVAQIMLLPSSFIF